MSHALDECSKILASHLPRRQALKQMLGVVGGAFLGLFGLGRRASAAADPCVQACQGRGCNRVAAVFAKCVAMCRANPKGVFCGCIVCPAGQVCKGGVCAKNQPMCTTSGTCGTLPNCPNFPDRPECFCGATTDNKVGCFNGFLLCEDFPECQTNADCRNGELCFKDTCCPRNTCFPTCTPAAPAAKLRASKGPTGAKK